MTFTEPAPLPTDDTRRKDIAGSAQTVCPETHACCPDQTQIEAAVHGFPCTTSKKTAPAPQAPTGTRFVYIIIFLIYPIYPEKISPAYRLAKECGPRLCDTAAVSEPGSGLLRLGME